MIAEQKDRTAVPKPAPRGEAALSPKAKQILHGARSAFHDLGYEGTSVDEIARRAGVSKPTLYSYFGDKQALFAASFSNECQALAEDGLSDAEFAHGSCVESALRGIARGLVAFLLSPGSMAMFRSAVAESARFPHLGRTYFEAGQNIRQRLIEILNRATAAGILRIDDVELAADQFMVLCKADEYWKRLFLQTDEPDQAAMNRVADGAVRLFFNGYGACCD